MTDETTDAAKQAHERAVVYARRVADAAKRAVDEEVRRITAEAVVEKSRAGQTT